MKKDLETAIFCLVIIGCLVLGNVVGREDGIKLARKQAIESSAGHYNYKTNADFTIEIVDFQFNNSTNRYK